MNPFGIFSGYDTTPTVATSLHCKVFRPLACFLDRGLQPILQKQIQDMRAAGLTVILTIRANGDYHVPTQPADREWFRSHLTQALDWYQPDIVAAENEMNTDSYWAGTPQEYLEELTWTVDTVRTYNGSHPQRRIYVTDGGLTSKGAGGVAAAYYLQLAEAPNATRQDKTRCVNFTKAALGANVHSVADVAAFLGKQDLTVPQALLDGIPGTGVDYLDFHSYNATAYSLGLLLDYLSAKTAMSILSTEMGIYSQDTRQLRGLLNTLLARSVVAVCWNNTKGTSGDRNQPLANPDGTLTALGRSYARIAGAQSVTVIGGPLTA